MPSYILIGLEHLLSSAAEDSQDLPSLKDCLGQRPSLPFPRSSHPSPLHTLRSRILMALGQDSSEECLDTLPAPTVLPAQGPAMSWATPQLDQRLRGSLPFSILLLSRPCQSFLQSTPSMDLPHQIPVSYPASRKPNLRHLVIKIKRNKTTHVQKACIVLKSCSN